MQGPIFASEMDTRQYVRADASGLLVVTGTTSEVFYDMMPNIQWRGGEFVEINIGLQWTDSTNGKTTTISYANDDDSETELFMSSVQTAGSVTGYRFHQKAAIDEGLAYIIRANVSGNTFSEGGSYSTSGTGTMLAHDLTVPGRFRIGLTLADAADEIKVLYSAVRISRPYE